MPAGSSAIAPSGTIACLRLASRTASGSKRSRRAKRAMICAIFSSISLIEHQLATGEAAHDLGRQVIRRRPEPTGGDDQVEPLVPHVPEGALEILRRGPRPR